jgi:hypothetical protein
MKKMIAFALALLAFAPAARAQSAYVAGAIGADVARTGSIDGMTQPGNGEALSFSLRLGAPVASRFGVEVDFTRPSMIERDDSPDVRILAAPVALALGPEFADLSLFPSSFKVHTEQRTTTVTASVFTWQEITPRFSMTYLAGVAFGRVERETSYSLGVPFPAIYPPTFASKTTHYDAGPMAGVEAGITLTEHGQIVPGVRMMSVGAGWIVRPSVGLRWGF